MGRSDASEGRHVSVPANDVLVLVVEDNPDHLELIVEALAQSCDRARIVTAHDGVDALDYLLGRAAHAGRDALKQPRLVILDMKLTLVHGLDVLKAMRADPMTTSVPVVMLSASTEKAELDRCYEAGANSVVRKVIDAGELGLKMKRVYDFWVTVNEAHRNSRV